MAAVIRSVVTYLPPGLLTNDDLHRDYPDWSVEKIAEKTGIERRHIAAPGEYSSDLAVKAARQLFDQGVDPESLDVLMLCTQTPDYIAPSTACLVQHKLGLSKSIMAFDYNLGCSGFVYGLGIAKALIASGQAQRILLITSDTYSRYIAHDDRSVRTLFGDAATAALIEAADDANPGPGGTLGSFVYGTDGGGAPNLLVTGSGIDGRAMDERSPANPPHPTLYMDGPEIFAFTLVTVPKTMRALYAKAGMEAESIDRFVFHQANRYMLDHLRRKLKISEERFIIEMADSGNTISSTIPIALTRSLADGRIHGGQRLALVGFGIGYSWGACTVDWR